jgi:hypothetical protein
LARAAAAGNNGYIYSSEIARGLDVVELASGPRRRQTLVQLANGLKGDVNGAGDAAKVRTLEAAVRALKGNQARAPPVADLFATRGLKHALGEDMP